MAVGMRETVLVPRFSRVLCVMVVLVCAVVVVSLIAYGRVDATLRYTPLAVLGADLAIVVFWLPRVRIGPSAVRVVNPLRTYDVTWPAVLDVDTKWTLTLVTAERRIQVYAAPSPGPFGNVGSLRRDARGALVRSDRRDTPSATGDIAAMVMLRQWQDHRDRGVADGEGEVRARVNAPWIIATAVLATVAAVALLWP